MGLLFQLNLLSTVGYYGPAIAKIADLLLAGDKIDFVGSDIHHLKHAQSFSQKLTLTSEKQLRVAMERNSFFATMKGE